MLNQEYQIVDVPTVNTYVIQARAAGTTISSITVDGQLVPSLVTANGSDTGNGGSSVVGAYQSIRALPWRLVVLVLVLVYGDTAHGEEAHLLLLQIPYVFGHKTILVRI